MSRISAIASVDVLVGRERARAEARLAGEDRVVVDPPGVVELVPDVLGEADVQDAVAVQVADLAAPDPEAELPALARARLDARPARDLGGDPLARGGGGRRHEPQCAPAGPRFPSAIGPRTAPNDEGPAGAGPSHCVCSVGSRRYLMNRISEYFGSGQRSSATIRSSLSATSRTASIAGMTVSATYLARVEHVVVLGVARALAVLEREDRLDELVDEARRSRPSARSTPAPSLGASSSPR